MCVHSMYTYATYVHIYIHTHTLITCINTLQTLIAPRQEPLKLLRENVGINTQIEF